MGNIWEKEKEELDMIKAAQGEDIIDIESQL